MVTSIISTLGVGSGIDTAALIDQLLTAEFDAKQKTNSRQTAEVNSQISSIGQIKSQLSSFAGALATLTKGGTLSTQPTSSDTSVLNVSALPGAKLAGLNASVEVRQLATTQSVSTNPFADRSTAIGGGTLTIQLGTATVAGGAITDFTAGSSAAINVTIDPNQSSLDDIAAAINAANAGVTATVLTDTAGARLSIKGASGAANAFTITATEDPDAPGLAALAVGVGATGTTVGSAAQDAIVAVDGVALRRPSNSISDLLPGVKFDLVSAKPGTTVTIGTKAPTDAITQAISNFVDSYNNLLNLFNTATNAKDGVLYRDQPTRTAQRALAQLTATTLAPASSKGGPRTLAEIGVATARDGTLSVDSAALAKALNSYPDSVEALFAPGKGASDGGLAAAFQAIVDRATDATYGLGASEATYNKKLTALADASSKIDSDKDIEKTRLTSQFASAESRIAAYKSTQSFLQQQIDSWTKKNS